MYLLPVVALLTLLVGSNKCDAFAGAVFARPPATNDPDDATQVQLHTGGDNILPFVVSTQTDQLDNSGMPRPMAVREPGAFRSRLTRFRSLVQSIQRYCFLYHRGCEDVDMDYVRARMIHQKRTATPAPSERFRLG